jgi:hypothetical protein
MSLCIWTSLHLNLPEHKKEHLQKYRKLGWMVLGLLAPEFVVWNAWEQRKKVKKLSALMKERGFMAEKLSTGKRVQRWFETAWRNTQIFLLLKAGDWPEPTAHHRHNGLIHAWTDVHSWLVVMGGVAFEDTSPEDQQFMPGDGQRQPLELEMFIWMVENRPHLIPDISCGYIEDKSKSDWLAKGLTCWQAGYFCIQCIFRLSQQNSIASITLLELNVFAHAVCALLLFLAWWDKPRDVAEPTLITGEEALNICAYLCGLTIPVSLVQNAILEPLDRGLEPTSPDACLRIVQSTSFIARVRSHQPVGLSLGYPYPVSMGSCNHYILEIRETYWFAQLRGPPHFPPHEVVVTLDGRIIERSVRVYKANITLTPPEKMELKILRITRSSRISNWVLHQGDFQPMVGYSSFAKLFTASTGWALAGLTFAAACYGGLHLIVWTSTFPSRNEAVIWRVASFTIFMTGPTCALMTLCFTLANECIPKRQKVLVQYNTIAMYRAILKFKVSTMILIVAVLSIWYILCRAFIVVECFILLAHIPETALHVPTWAAYIPSFN